MPGKEASLTEPHETRPTGGQFTGCPTPSHLPSRLRHRDCGPAARHTPERMTQGPQDTGRECRTHGPPESGTRTKGSKLWKLQLHILNRAAPRQTHSLTRVWAAAKGFSGQVDTSKHRWPVSAELETLRKDGRKGSRPGTGRDENASARLPRPDTAQEKVGEHGPAWTPQAETQRGKDRRGPEMTARRWATRVPTRHEALSVPEQLGEVAHPRSVTSGRTRQPRPSAWRFTVPMTSRGHRWYRDPQGPEESRPPRSK